MKRLILAATILTTAGFASSAAVAEAPDGPDASGGQHAVFVQTNDPAGNAIVVYHRSSDGTLSLAATGGPTVGGAFTVGSGAVLDLTGSQTRTYVGNYTGTGAGTIQLSNGTLQVGAAGATFNFPGSLFQWTGGTLSGPGVLTNTNTLNINGNVSLSGLTLNNAGTVTWLGTGNITNISGPVFNNLAGGYRGSTGRTLSSPRIIGSHQ